MRPYFYRGDKYSNFGDELSTVLWSAYGLKLESGSEGLLAGIGTLLHSKNTGLNERPLIVFGTGAGYGPVPDLAGAEVRFVRGPKSAHVLGGRYKWITDPAILVANIVDKKPVYDVAFMPHWTTITNDPTLAQRLQDVGIHVIDPTKPVKEVLLDVAGAKLLLSEAMHGAIVADALRIPWIPIYAQHGHLFKWLDWTQSMDLKYDPVMAEVSSLRWAADNVEPFLSNETVHSSKLASVGLEMKWLQNRLRG